MKQLVLALVGALLAGAVLWLALARSERIGPVAESAADERSTVEPAGVQLAPPLLASGSERVELALADADDAPDVTDAQLDAEPSATARDTILFHARVVDALTQRPIVGARVFRKQGALHFADGGRELAGAPHAWAESDAAGLVALDLARRGSVLVLAVGYAPALFYVESGHETEERAAWLELLPAPALDVRVLVAPDAPLAGAEVEVIIRGRPETRMDSGAMRIGGTGTQFTASARTDDHGRARFDDLPAETPFVLRFLPEGRLVAEPEKLALLAGERRSIERTVGFATVRGRVVDQHGIAVAGCYLWLAGSPPPGLGTRLVQPEVEEAATTGRDGEFLFTGIPYGTWLIGPSSLHAKDFSSKGRPCLVDRPAVEVEVRVSRGLPIEGRVVRENGEPAEAFVTATPVDAVSTEPLFVQSGQDGTFRFPSVEPGSHRIHANDGVGQSDALTVEAGSTGMALRLGATKRLYLRVGQLEAGAGVSVMQLAATGYMSGFWITSSGSAPVKKRWEVEVAPGYSLCVVSRDSIRAVPEETLSSLPPDGELVLDLEPGAHLTAVNCARERAHDLRLWGAGCLLSQSNLIPGESATCLVPPGEVRAELLEHGRVVASATLALAPGERRRVTLTPGD